MTLDLLKRSESASPLSAVEHDANLTAIEDEVNDKEPASAVLAAIRALTPAADRGIYFTGETTAEVFTLTAAARGLIDDASVSAMRATLELGGAAILNVGTSAGTVAAGDHDHDAAYEPLVAETTVANPASPYSWDVSVNPRLLITGLDHALTINATGITDGRHYSLVVVQDVTGGRTLTFSTNFVGAGSLMQVLGPNGVGQYSFRASDGSLVAQAHLVASEVEATDGASNSRLMTPLRVEQHGNANYSLLDHNHDGVYLASAGADTITTLGDAASLAAQHGALHDDTGTLRLRRVRVRHATTPASPVTLTLADATDRAIEVIVAPDQTGLVTIERESDAITINGGASVELIGAGSSVVLIPLGSGVWLAKGDIRDTIDFAGTVITGVHQVLADEEKTSNFTLAMADAHQKMLRVNSETTVTVTVPLNSSVPITVGSVFHFVQWGEGMVSLNWPGGVTVQVLAGHEPDTSARYAVMSLWKQGTDVWLLYGALAEAAA